MNEIRKIRPAHPSGSHAYRAKPTEAPARNMEVLPPRPPLPRHAGKRRTDAPVAPPRPSTPFIAQYVDQLWAWPPRDQTSRHAAAGQAYQDAGDLLREITGRPFARHMDRKF